MSVQLDTVPGTPLDSGKPINVSVSFWQEQEGIGLCLIAEYEYPAELAGDEYWTQTGGEVLEESEGEHTLAPHLTVSGGNAIRYADPPIVQPPNGELTPDIQFLPQIDSEQIDWVHLGDFPSDTIEFNLPSVTRYSPMGPVVDATATDPAIAWVTGCLVIDGEPYSRDGLAKSTYIFEWGDPAAVVSDANTAESRVRFVYTPDDSNPITSIAPEAEEVAAYRFEHWFPYNEHFTTRVSYVSTKTQGLVEASHWVAGGVGLVLLADIAHFMIWRRRET